MSEKCKVENPSEGLLMWTFYILMTTLVTLFLVGLGVLIYNGTRDANLEYAQKVAQCKIP